MTFNSFEFLLFYPIVLGLYFILPHKLRWVMLLAASYYFYACYRFELLFLIIGTTLVSWLMSRVIERCESVKVKKLCLAFTLVVCLGVLALYKYADFFIGSVGGIISLFGSEASFTELSLVLPVGISFYTFQTLSYVIDVYRGDVKTEPNFFFYALFVSFFPQLVAGPIERPDNLIPQIKEEHSWNRDNALSGGKRMMLGFFKKIAVADVISVYVDAVYNNPEGADSLGVIAATLLFAMQIYCDFSGYTDIAIGCARVMGIRLMKNFDYPYSAVTVKDFWARWHISLSTWFKDYLYFPLGGSRCGRCRHLLNLMIVFTVSGLWHGAAWTFVLWGVLHGIYRIIGTLTIGPRDRLVEKCGKNPADRSVMAIRRVITFGLVSFAWIFFRANSVGDLGIILTRLFTGFASPRETLGALGLDLAGILTVVLSLGTLYLLDKMLDYEDENPASEIMVKSGAFLYIIWAVLMCWMLLFSKDMMSTFIYFQF